MCRKKDRQVHEIDETDYESDFEALYVGALDFSKSSDQSDLNDSFVENLYVGDKQLSFQLDTGAKCNVLSKSDYNTLNIKGPLKQAT